MLRTLLYLLFLVGFSGCAAVFVQPKTTPPSVSLPELTEEITAQIRSEFREKVQENERVQRIADPLFLASADLCGQTRMEYGFHWIDAAVLNQMTPIGRAILMDYHGLSYQDFDEQNPFPFISSIRNQSGAEEGGLKKRDRIVQFDGQSIEPLYEGSQTGKNRFGYTTKKGKWVGTFSSTISSSLREKKDSVVVQVLRKIPDTDTDDDLYFTEHKPVYKDTVFQLVLSPKKICDHQVVVLASGTKNAYTDGENIGITTGFLSSIDDQELAFIISHELAHIIEDHIGKKKSNQFVGSLLGVTLDALAESLGTRTYRRYEYQMAKVGQNAFTQQFEAEADYIGLYVLARAGYSTENVASFWQKMGREMPIESNSLTGTHPPTAYRYLMLNKTHAEIESKKAKGEALLPNRPEE